MTEERVDFSGNRKIEQCRFCGSYSHGSSWHDPYSPENQIHLWLSRRSVERIAAWEHKSPNVQLNIEGVEVQVACRAVLEAERG